MRLRWRANDLEQFLPNTSGADLGANGVAISTIMNIGLAVPSPSS